MLSHTTTRPTLARSLHQQVLINSTTPSTSALSDSLPQPSTTPTAFDSPFTLASFRQPSAAPDNPASLSTAFGSLRSLRQPSAVSASLRSFTFDITFTPQCSHRLNSGRAPYKHYKLFHLAVQPSIKFWPHFLQTLRRANTFSAGNAHIRLLKWHTARPASHTLTDATSRLQYPGSLSHTHPTSVISSPASSLHAYTSTPTGPPSCPFS